MKPKKRTYPEEGKKNTETPANKATQGEGEKPGAAPAQEGKMVGKPTKAHLEKRAVGKILRILIKNREHYPNGMTIDDLCGVSNYLNKYIGRTWLRQIMDDLLSEYALVSETTYPPQTFWAHTLPLNLPES